MHLLPHKFRSITEKQWKSGRNRHLCATCARDYSDFVHLMLPWPLILAIEDYYVPESAAALMEGLRGLDDEAVSITLHAMDAEDEFQPN